MLLDYQKYQIGFIIISHTKTNLPAWLITIMITIIKKNGQTFNMILYSQYLDISLRMEFFYSCFHTIQDNGQHFYGAICNLVELLIQVAHGNQFP